VHLNLITGRLYRKFARFWNSPFITGSRIWLRKIVDEMKIIDFLSPETILTRMKSTDKDGAIKELSDAVSVFTGIESEKIVSVILERERLGSTGIGGGIAIPHGKLKKLDRMVIGFGRSDKGVRFDSLDGKPVFIFWLLLSPYDSTGLHLRLLARIAKLMKDDEFKKKLMDAKSPEDVIHSIEAEDREI